MNTDSIDKLAFTVSEASIKAGVGRDGIYTAIREKRLEAKKRGRRTLITADALRRFLEALPAVHL
jgi:excisionase family DNA binding protein